MRAHLELAVGNDEEKTYVVAGAARILSIT